eukprot:jgi/Botrbrau1/2246/Bobra.101_2s0074.1
MVHVYYRNTHVFRVRGERQKSFAYIEAKLGEESFASGGWAKGKMCIPSIQRVKRRVSCDCQCGEVHLQYSFQLRSTYAVQYQMYNERILACGPRGSQAHLLHGTTAGELGWL